jgi:hypothetical protein
MGLLSGRGHLHSSLYVKLVPERRCSALSLRCVESVSGAVAAVRGVSVRRGLCLCATYEESGGDDIVKP